MSVLFILFGIIFALYGGIVLVILGTGAWFNFVFAGIGVFLILLGALWKIKGFPGWLKAAIIIVLVLAIAVTAFFEYRIISFAKAEPEDNADYVIILGAKVNGSNPSVEFSARIREAMSYLVKNPRTKVITTGAQGPDENMSEAEAAEKVILGARIHEDRIIREDRSTSTAENLANAADIIRSKGSDPSRAKVVIVSSAFHLYRASQYAKSIGYENVSYAGSNGLFLLIPQYYFREFAALVKEYMDGNLKFSFK
jgi:uncharacterized SAM-binding protein YcdF (DUF218 family)